MTKDKDLLIDDLIELFDQFVDQCDLDEDRWVAAKDFAEYAYKLIGSKFQDLAVYSYAEDFALSSTGDAPFYDLYDEKDEKEQQNERDWEAQCAF